MSLQYLRDLSLALAQVKKKLQQGAESINAISTEALQETGFRCALRIYSG